MALTFRTGSGGKGSALTIEELDNNFRHFTGSHSITGSLIISSSLIVSGGMSISGSIISTEEEATLGSLAHPWKHVYTSGDSLILVSGSGAGQATGSISFGDGKVTFDSSAGVVMTGSLTGSFTGSANATGSFTGSFTGSVDTQFNSGSCLIGCTSSVAPSYTAQEGTFVFVASGSGEHFIYAFVGGGWKSGSLA